ncbi:MAG: carboxypeptidase regulatory-like domain-containing protein [Haliscomenobacter sp.]|nr:carboxypeptidase regulatory-like domain-containing protein [Haliscomenobacter sp.]
MVTCDDRPTVLAYVYAWDANGNAGYCETLVLLQDPSQELCAEIGKGSVSGTVRTVRGRPIEGAELILDGNRIEQRLTGTEGTYVFEFLKPGDYQIRPRLDSNYKEGVTTFDIVKILRHILGDEKFESPYQYLAADVDLSGSVTTLDIIQIRRLVLSVEIDFRQTPSWRFIPAGYQFANPDDPLKESFPEVRSFYGLSGNILAADFVGIKMGDVTGDALRGDSGPTVLIQSPQRVRRNPKEKEEPTARKKRSRGPDR